MDYWKLNISAKMHLITLFIKLKLYVVSYVLFGVENVGVFRICWNFSYGDLKFDN